MSQSESQDEHFASNEKVDQLSESTDDCEQLEHSEISEQQSSGMDETSELPPSQSLQEAVDRMSLSLSTETVALLDRYCLALWEWNEKINLTRHTTYDKFVQRDLLDTVQLAAHIPQGEDVLDIGTGGGVPGIPLYIIRPDLNVSLCDSVTKKAKVVSDIVKKLNLPIAVYPDRAQVVLEDIRFHSVVTRAAGSIRQLLNWLSEHWMSFDKILAIKGPRWTEERGEARHHGLMANIELRKLAEYPMPGTKSQSVILQLRRARSQ